VIVHAILIEVSDIADTDKERQKSLKLENPEKRCAAGRKPNRQTHCESSFSSCTERHLEVIKRVDASRRRSADEFLTLRVPASARKTTQIAGEMPLTATK